MIVGYLGDVPFEVAESLVRTLDQITIEESATFAVQERADAAPRLQFIGPGESTARFSMLLRAELGVNPVAEMHRLRGYLRTGRLLRWTLGTEIVGGAGSTWLVESISDERDVIGARGETISTSLQVTLRRQPPVTTKATGWHV